MDGITMGFQVGKNSKTQGLGSKWVVVKFVVPFRIPVIIRHLIFRVPKKGS